MGFFYTKSKQKYYQYFPYPQNKQINITAKIINNPEKTKKGYKFLAKTIPENHKIFIKLYTKNNNLKYAHIYKIQGKFIPIANPSNPGQFNYKQYLFTKGIKSIFIADKVKYIKSTIPNPFKSFAYYLKAKILNINRKTLPYPYSELYTGLVFGDQGTSLPQDIADAYQKTGLTHLLVVSGSQVSLLAGIILILFQSFKFSRKRIFWPITIILILFYFLTGGGASIFRAILMMEIVLFLRVLKRNPSFYHIFAFTALVMLIINPLYLYDIGFQLSFMATFALVYGVAKVQKILWDKLPKFIVNSLSLSLAPFIFTTPLIWYYFHRISLISLVSNFLVINAIEILVPIGFFSTLIGFFLLPITQIINNFSYVVMYILNKIVNYLASLPFASINISASSGIVTIFLILFIIYSLHQLANKTYKNLKIPIYIFLIFICFHFSSFILPQKNLEVIVFDVGQGDSILIRTPHKKNILIDAGPISYDFDTGEVIYDSGRDIIFPALSSFGINKLDLIIPTHFHEDHIGGLPFLLQNIATQVILDNGRLTYTKIIPFQTSFSERKYRKIIKQKHLKPILVHGFHSIQIEDNIILKLLHPMANWQFATNKNNNSIVCQLSYKDIDFLFMGDLEKEVEDLLVQKYGKQLQSEIIKVGHHGSNSSSSIPFLNKVSPKYAIISVGKNNKFHHPHPSTISRYRQYHVKILRTDQQGAIVIKTNGHKIYYKTYKVSWLSR